MEDRNKIVSQISLVFQQYDYKIDRIEFNSITDTFDKVTITYSQNNILRGIISYSYEKSHITQDNKLTNYLYCVLNNTLKEE